MYFMAVFVLIPYFVFASFKSHNTKYHPSSFWYHKIPIFIEFMVVCSLVSFCAYYLKYCQPSYYVIPIILVFLGIAFILALDVTFITMDSLCLDLWAWLRLDIHNHVVPDDSYPAPYYVPFAKDVAYQRYRLHDEVTDCPICLDSFEEVDSSRALLQCGHLFHSDCIDKWEQEQWTNGRCIRPFCQCPCCRRWYHSDFEKFEYDTNYEHPKFYQYPGRAWMHESFWKGEIRRYVDHAKCFWKH